MVGPTGYVKPFWLQRASNVRLAGVTYSDVKLYPKVTLALGAIL